MTSVCVESTLDGYRIDFELYWNNFVSNQLDTVWDGGRRARLQLMVFIPAICLHGIQCEKEVQKLTLYNYTSSNQRVWVRSTPQL